MVLASPAPSSTGTSTTLLLLLRSFCRPAMELNNISSYFRVLLSPDFNIGLYSLISLIHFFSLRLSLYLLLLTAHLSISLICCCYLPVVIHGNKSFSGNALPYLVLCAVLPGGRCQLLPPCCPCRSPQGRLPALAAGHRLHRLSPLFSGRLQIL